MLGDSLEALEELALHPGRFAFKAVSFPHSISKRLPSFPTLSLQEIQILSFRGRVDF